MSQQFYCSYKPLLSNLSSLILLIEENAEMLTETSKMEKETSDLMTEIDTKVAQWPMLDQTQMVPNSIFL